MEGVNLQIWNSFPNTEMSPWYRLPSLRVAPASNIQVSTDHCIENSFNLELTTDPVIKSFCADLNCWIKSDTERWLQHLPSIVELPLLPTNFYNEIADFEVEVAEGRWRRGVMSLKRECEAIILGLQYFAFLQSEILHLFLLGVLVGICYWQSRENSSKETWLKAKHWRGVSVGIYAFNHVCGKIFYYEW